ncbi:MAG: Ig-like domain-containing protein [Thermodesulfobacteriota bacterium]
MREGVSKRACAAAAALLLAGCGGGGGGGAGGPGGPAAVVTGLVVVQDEVARRDPRALGAPPESWSDQAGGARRRAALAHADWSIAGGPAGTTAADGTFQIGGLAPGRHALRITRSLAGDLVTATLPFAVGDQGTASVLVEIAWGETRSSSRFTHDGREVEEVFAPHDVHVVLEDGRIVELGDGTRVWEDPDRDGDFDRCTVVREAATCVVVEIEALQAAAPERLRVGERAYAHAALLLDDGSVLDVTSLARWRSANAAVASVDAFGEIAPLAPGSTEIEARLGDLGSGPMTLEVVARPPLRRIEVQNADCYYPAGLAGRDEPSLDARPPSPEDGIWAPVCRQVVEVGGGLRFVALGELEDETYDDLSEEVEWLVEPADLGSVDAGTFTGARAGTGQLRARLGEVASEATTVPVVDEPTLQAIYVYAEDGGVGLPIPGAVSPGDPADAADVLPCPSSGCSFQLAVLRGDDLPLRANGEYDTGLWRDLTGEVRWASSAEAVATVAASGVVSAHAAGDTAVTASLGEVTSSPLGVRVVDQATLQQLWIQQQGERVVARGEQRFFTATGSYDLGFGRDVTTEAAWRTSDASIARFDEPGVLTAVAAGDVAVWAELDGVASEPASLEVFETGELDYCDPASVNRATWSDGYNRVVLESDCARYTQPDVVALRFTVTESSSPGGIFDPCLDLYVYQGDVRVRTIREEGCGDPFLPDGAPGLDQEVLKYQLRAFWDLKDESGLPAPAGTYQIHGRFYLYYDPVVTLTVTID